MWGLLLLMHLSLGGISDYIYIYNTPVDLKGDCNLSMTRITSKTGSMPQSSKLGNIYDLTYYKFLNSKVEQNVIPFYSERI